MSKESWYASKLSDTDIVRISVSDNWIVDYDKSRGMYRVSYFEDGHFVDECWFDAYEENCLFVECKFTDEKLKEMIKQAEFDLINDGYDLEKLKKYTD